MSGVGAAAAGGQPGDDGGHDAEDARDTRDAGKGGGLPRLLVVTGPPAAGKTTLARALCAELGWPRIARDEIMEGLLSSLDSLEDGDAASEREPKRLALEAFFDTIAALVARDVSLIAEAAFQHALWARGLQPLLGRADIRIVRCTLDPELARRRFAKRAAEGEHRPRVHGPPGEAPPAQRYAPPELSVPTLDVDTTEGYAPDWPAIVEFVTAHPR